MNKNTIIKERIDLIRNLTNLKEHFRGLDKIVYSEEKNTASHPTFRHFHGLRIYLALTCFDVLGQPHEWLDFHSWLNSSKTELERSNIFEKYENLDFHERIIKVHDEYNKIYSVKNSFYRFIRNILNDKTRSKLFNSIRVSKRISEEIHTPDGGLIPAMGQDIEVSNEQKEKFLFNARNSFTHSGISFGNDVAGLVDGEGLVSIGDKEIYFQLPIHNETKGKDKLTYSVVNWPGILVEILEETINKNN